MCVCVVIYVWCSFIYIMMDVCLCSNICLLLVLIYMLDGWLYSDICLLLLMCPNSSPLFLSEDAVLRSALSRNIFISLLICNWY